MCTKLVHDKDSNIFDNVTCFHSPFLIAELNAPLGGFSAKRSGEKKKQEETGLCPVFPLVLRSK